MQIDFTNLETQVAAWRVARVQHVREEYGDDAANATAADLKAKPWLALQWYVEDNIPQEQRAA